MRSTESPNASIRWVVLRICVLAVVTTAGCATFRPVPIDEVPFRERGLTQEQGSVRVTVAVPSPEESKKLFGVNLAQHNIQPVWLEIRNNDTVPQWFCPSHLDPVYYSANEAAFRSHLPLGGEANKKMTQYFQAMRFEDFIPAGTTASGFVYTHLDQGTKHVTVTLLSIGACKTFTFVVPVPGLRIDYQQMDFEKLYGKNELKAVDEKGLRETLEKLPCCTMNKKGTASGDPLNLVLVGHGEEILTALVQSGWDETESLYRRSALETVKSFLFGKEYRYSPVSPLYVFGRRQDAAFQKARQTINERNHLRLWLTPNTFEGKPVWIGQISRDIGVKFTLKEGFIVTHIIDPDVDHDRWFLVQNLLDVQRVAKLGFVGGVGQASPSEPRHNLGGDPYFTDGFRSVVILSDKPVPYEKLEFLDWEFPRRLEKYRKDMIDR